MYVGLENRKKDIRRIGRHLVRRRNGSKLLGAGIKVSIDRNGGELPASSRNYEIKWKRASDIRLILSCSDGGM